MPEPLLVLVHIHKTAGNSVRDLLWDNYDPEVEFLDEFVQPRTFDDDGRAILPTDGRPDMKRIVRRASDPRVRCAALNLGYGVHRALPRPVRYFSVARQPIARCVSFWYFAHSKRTERPWWKDFEELDFDIERILASPRGSEFRNNQTRMLAGVPDVEIGERHLRAAQDNIHEHFDVVGTVEALPSVVGIMCKLYGWQERALERLNAGDYGDDTLLPAGAPEAFAEANHVDARLYRWLNEDHLPSRLRELGLE